MPTQKRAWVDESDRQAERDMPAFLKLSHQTPAWAISDARRDEYEVDAANRSDHSNDNDNNDDRGLAARVQDARRKRFRNDDLDALLSRTEPLLASRYDRQHMVPPSVLSIVRLPKDGARSVQWHRNGQLCIVGGHHHVYAFHAAGKFVEQLSKVDVKKRLERLELSASGEDALVVAHEAYVPLSVSLATGQVTPLHFLDARDSAIHRNGRRDNTKSDFFISRVVARPQDSTSRMIAVASGSTVRLGALASGSIVASLCTDEAVTDVAFTGPNEIALAAGNKLTIYDIRKTAKFLYDIVDDGALHITSFAVSRSSVAVGSSSGVVSVYSRDSLNAAKDSSSNSTRAAGKSAPIAPVKILKNLTTAINNLSLGTDSNGDDVLAFSTRGQKAGFRLAHLPQCQVVPSFPAVSSRHEFPQSLVIAPTVPILSVGERGRVVNYAL